MKPTYDAAVKEEVHKRMSPPSRESIPEISRCTGIATSTLYSWKRQWRSRGDLVPASTSPAEDWTPADKLAAVLHSTGLNGADLGAFCRERGLYPKQLARWRQAAEDANSSTAATAPPSSLQDAGTQAMDRNLPGSWGGQRLGCAGCGGAP